MPKIAVDAAGNVFIADASRIRKISNGIITTIAGNGTAASSGDGGPALSAGIQFAGAIAVGPDARVYFGDGTLVRVLTPTGTACSATPVPAAFTVPPVGGTLTISVQTSTASCPGAAPAGLPSWISSQGTTPVFSGPASISVTVAANTGAARTAPISVAGHAVSISQAGGHSGPSITSFGTIYSPQSLFVQPGSWATIYGSNLADSVSVWNNDFPTQLGGTTVTVNGKPAYLWYVSPGQINLQVPDDSAFGLADVVVTTSYGSAALGAQLTEEWPTLCLLSAKYPAAVILTPNGSGAYQNGTYDLR